jgi:ABC-type Mn2+/Zn2+ transport system permease subunit
MSFIQSFGQVMAAAVFGGALCGFVGAFLLGLRMPFLAVFASHAALAGAVFGDLAGWPHGVSGFLGAMLGAGMLGWLMKKRRIEGNAAIGALFTLSMALVFLGMAFFKGPKSAQLSLLWGSLLFVSWGQTVLMGLMVLVFLVFYFVFEKELKLLLFDRRLAAVYLPEGLLLTVFLCFASGTVAVNLETVGGLLLYCLLFNPPVAATRLCRSFRMTLWVSALFGSASALAGFGVAYILDLPVGACIGLVSSVLLGLVLGFTKPTKTQ